MISSERAFERAAELAEAERHEGVLRVRRRTAGTGSHDCVDCGDTIPAARRQALPDADRCVGCQEDFEKGV